MPGRCWKLLKENKKNKKLLHINAGLVPASKNRVNTLCSQAAKQYCTGMWFTCKARDLSNFKS
jgi:hypothetical protein